MWQGFLLIHSPIKCSRIVIKIAPTHKVFNSFRKDWYKDNYTIETFLDKDNIMKQTGIKLSAFEIREIDKIKKDLDLSRSEVIRRALVHYIDFVREKKAKLEHSLLKH